MVILRKLNRIFDRITKVRLLIILVAIIAGGFLEMLAISLISPFIAVLLNNSMIHDNPYISWVYEFLGFRSTTSFLAFLAFMLAVVYVFRGAYFFVLNRVKYRFTAKRQAALSEKLLTKLLDFSYLYHTHKNIATIQRIVRGDVGEMFNMINGMLTLLTDFFMALFILALLFVTSPVMSLCVVVLALSCVLLYFKAFRKDIRLAGKINRETQIKMGKALNQVFGGIKEVKILQRESYFRKTYKTHNDAFVRTSTRFKTLDAIPKLAIEVVCFGGAFIILGFFILGGADLAGMVPQLSLFVLAAFRLLPGISRQVSSINAVLYNHASVDSVYTSLFEEKDIAAEVSAQAEEVATRAVGDIIIQDISFKYPNSNETVLKNVSFTIHKNESVAFVGPSGAGKTTLADLILGILSPDEGGVFYNGKSIHSNFKEWVRNLGYIPQHIYLLDESILSNVAFGIDEKKIDEEKAWRALEQAQLKEFVESLPKGIQTFVGDRGVRLSGGQRQRIGIARAMYEDPPFLVLDEATSSLDNDTERAVMEAVMGFHGSKTLIIVAHRLSTIEHCDKIYRVDNKTVTRER